MKHDRQVSFSLTSAWRSVTAPVMALAEELALRRAGRARPAMSLRVRAGGIDVMRADAGSLRLQHTLEGRPQIAAQQLDDELAGQVALVFAEDQSISQRIILPQQPGDVLTSIVRNKVESLAPWPLAQCAWGMRASPIAGDPDHVAVDVGVVSRVLLDDLTGILRSSGTEVKAASIILPGGAEVEIDLGGDVIRRAARSRAILSAKLAAALLVALLGAGLYWVYRTDAEAARLEAETAASVASLKPSGALAGESSLVAAANRLRQQRAERLPAAAILDEVTRLLPDTVFLTFFALSGDEIVLKGQGSGIPSLIALLEASPRFQSVNFASATELNEESKANSFSLSVKLEKAQP